MKNKICIEDVKGFIVDYEVEKFRDKTTIVKATLKNGFVIVESSSCVDPINFDKEIGFKMCMERIENKIWELLGFHLQNELNGVDIHEEN